MTDGRGQFVDDLKSTKVDVEVKVRPLSGYWVIKGPSVSRKDSGSTDSKSGFSLPSVDRKAEELKCIWERPLASFSLSSGAPTPPPVSTPLPEWKNTLDIVKMKRSFWNKEKSSKTNSTNSSASQCRCKPRRRRSKHRKPQDENEEIAKKIFPSLVKEIYFKAPREVSSKDVTLNKTKKSERIKKAINLTKQTADGDGSFWEFKYWIILVVFWLAILIYRSMLIDE